MILVFNPPHIVHGNIYVCWDRFSASNFFQWTAISVTILLVGNQVLCRAFRSCIRNLNFFWQRNSMITKVDISHLLVRWRVTSQTTSGYFLAVFIVTKTPFPVASLGQLNVCTLTDAFSGTFSICPQLVLTFVVNGFNVILPTSTPMLSIHSIKGGVWTEKISPKCTSLGLKLFCGVVFVANKSKFPFEGKRYQFKLNQGADIMLISIH